MSENIPNLWTTQFSTNLQMRLQQTTSKLRGKVMEGFHVGKQASPVQYMNPVKLQAPTGRFAPLGRVDTDFQRRWVFPQDGELPQLIDTFDELRTIIDPKSQYVTNAAAAVGRAWDDAIIAAAFGTAQIGTDAGGLSSETFSTTNYQVASTFASGSTASGLTVPKAAAIRQSSQARPTAAAALVTYWDFGSMIVRSSSKVSMSCGSSPSCGNTHRRWKSVSTRPSGAKRPVGATSFTGFMY